MTKKTAFLLISIPLFLIAGVISLALYLFPAYEKKDAPQIKTSSEKKPEANGNNNPASNTTTIREEGNRGVEIIYKDGKFNVQTVTVGDNGNCLLHIINSDSVQLTIRLSPPPPRNDWGPQYDPIPSGGEIIIDPRFRIPEIAFYNKEKPSEEFSVKLGEGCDQF